MLDHVFHLLRRRRIRPSLAPSRPSLKKKRKHIRRHQQSRVLQRRSHHLGRQRRPRCHVHENCVWGRHRRRRDSRQHFHGRHERAAQHRRLLKPFTRKTRRSGRCTLRPVVFWSTTAEAVGRKQNRCSGALLGPVILWPITAETFRSKRRRRGGLDGQL